MLAEFEIWFLPNNLRISSEKAANLLRVSDCDVLYLNIPRELNWLVDDLAYGAPYEQFIEEVKRLNIIREPIAKWEYKLKPILLEIRGVKLRRPGLEIICYRKNDLENLSTEIAEEIATLILRTSISGRANVREWRNIISRIVNDVASLADNECNYILRTWMESYCGRKTICLVDYPARRLLRRARELGIKAALRCIFTPYIFTPLEVLIREFIIASKRGVNIDDEKIEKLVKMHVDFIRNYILLSDCYDEAYFKWLKDGHYKLY